MNITRDRLHTIGWGTALAICLALTMALTFRVNAVKSEVQLADRQLVDLQQQNMFLETEFETRANQEQLRAINAVDFGYEAPTAGQYLENERQLAELGKPAAPDAPAPIRFANADGTAGAGAGGGDGNDAATSMVSPVSGHLIGQAVAAEVPAGARPGPGLLQHASLRERLSHIDRVLGGGAGNTGEGISRE